ncbi:hypothetical protein [Patulibacter sp.]|uniref:hypothetical protein n=1 Tax=Patulibacter sp. TaxID=1912859 RepID=UPI0027292498|nr:hypothetical protein [Patulibacter sp.]MDO9409810.1 hypothetical protein [Patulibacter sp.]
MGFFPTEPPEPRTEEHDEAWQAYARFEGHTVPGAVPEPIVVAATPLVTVIATLTVSEDALGVTWHTIARRVPTGPAADQLALREVARDGPLPDEFLRLGVAYADGRSATNLPWEDDDEVDDDERDPDRLSWRMRGGSGTPTVSTSAVVVSPGPDDGPVTLVCEWPALGVGEHRATVPPDVLDRARLLAISVEPIEDDEG